MPGTLVTSGTTITSTMDSVGSRGRDEYYGIRLSAGQTLSVTLMIDCASAIGGACPYTRLELAYPGKGYNAADWNTFGSGWQPISGHWLITESGLFSVRVHDFTMGGDVYRYTITFTVAT